MTITTVVHEIAEQMGLLALKVSEVTLTDGERIGCRDAFLLNITAHGRLTSSLIYRSDLDDINQGSVNDRMEIRIRNALAKLSQMMDI